MWPGTPAATPPGKELGLIPCWDGGIRPRWTAEKKIWELKREDTVFTYKVYIHAVKGLTGVQAPTELERPLLVVNPHRKHAKE